ncbi:MAG: PEP-CTERM sorting domain-containing protein [Phycisphaerae bacterium]|jgi:hypothetical protein
MKRVAAVVLVLGFLSTSAFGAAVIGFTQTSPDPFNDANDGATTATFDVTLLSTDLTGGVASSVNMDLGSDDGLDISFVHALGWTLTSVDDPGRGVFADDVFLDGVDFGAGSTAPVLLGEMTVDAAGAALGLRSFGVAGQFGQGAERDDIVLAEGHGLVNVVPEPATLSLLLLGAAGLIRRRTAR